MKLSLLIITDDQDDQEIFGEAITRVDMSIHYESALSCRAALHKLHEARHLPDVILLDAYLHDMNSLDCLRELKSEKKFAAIPVIVIDAVQNENFCVAAMNLDADSYFVKPVSFIDIQNFFKQIQEKFSSEKG